MNKRELALLERAFSAEVEAAINKTGLHLMQTKATKVADKLVSDGLLRKVSTSVGNGPLTIRLSGYELTEVGRMAYCMTC